jgi:hypothetical protein
LPAHHCGPKPPTRCCHRISANACRPPYCPPPCWRATTPPPAQDPPSSACGTLFLEGFDSWNATGTENELGNLPPATGDLCVGVWKLQGKTVELTTHVAWLYDTSNNYQGTVNITESNQVASDGNSYTGTFDAKFTDPNGNLFNEVTGTTSADRLVQ